MIEKSIQTADDQIKLLVLEKLREAGDEQPFESDNPQDLQARTLREMLRLQRRLDVFERYTPDTFRDASLFEFYDRERSVSNRDYLATKNPVYLERANSRRLSMHSIRLKYEVGGGRSNFAIVFETARVDIRSFSIIKDSLAKK